MGKGSGRTKGGQALRTKIVPSRIADHIKREGGGAGFRGVVAIHLPEKMRWRPFSMRWRIKEGVKSKASKKV